MLKNIISLDIKEVTISDDGFTCNSLPIEILEVGNVDKMDSISYFVLKDELSNLRVGNAKVKRRGEVSGGGKKPWKQKGTGKARQGSIRAPHWPGGGQCFGPNGRIYTKKINKKLLNKYVVSLITDKMKNDEIFVLNNNCSKTKNALFQLNNFFVSNIKQEDLKKKNCFVSSYEEIDKIRTLQNLPKEKNKFVNSSSILCRDITYNKFIFFLGIETLNRFIYKFKLAGEIEKNE